MIPTQKTCKKITIMYNVKKLIVCAVITDIIIGIGYF